MRTAPLTPRYGTSRDARSSAQEPACASLELIPDTGNGQEIAISASSYRTHWFSVGSCGRSIR